MYRHRQEWLNSAVNPDIIERNVRTIEDSRELDQLLNRNTERRWKHSTHLVPGWAVAGVDPRTGERCYRGAQFKPDVAPRRLDDQDKPIPGKFCKYLAASGETPEPLFLDTGDSRYWHNLLKDGNQPVHVVEGVKKAGCLLTANFAAIAISGCCNGQHQGKLNPQIAAFYTKGRDVYLWPDADWQDNPQVAAGWKKLANLIKRRGCTVYVCTWPEGKGVDDFTAGGGDVRAVYDDALPLTEWLAQVKENLAELRLGLPRLPQDKVLQALDKELGEYLRFNELTQAVELNGSPVDLDTAYLALSQHLGALITKELCGDALLFLAQRRRFNPVVNYLERVAETVAPIPIDDLASRYFGTKEPIYDTFIKKFLIGAVARAFSPGCKLDTALILQGLQGQGKSSFFATLGGAWFDDSMGTLDGKDDVMTLHRSWMMEWSEFDHVSGHRQASQIKAFLSRRVDRFRPPYGRSVKEFPRRGVICGSTNQQEFMNDPTGSRRFWIVPTGSQPIDIATLAQERDAICAAAVLAYRNGEQWWLTPDEYNQSEKLNLDYQQVDPWQETISGKLKQPGAPTGIPTSFILEQWLEIPTGRQGKLEQRRIGSIMRNLGYELRNHRLDGKQTKTWIKNSQGEVYPNIGSIGSTTTKTGSGTGLEGATDTPKTATDKDPISSNLATDVLPISSTATDIGSIWKPPLGAGSSIPATDATDKPANFPLQQKFRPGQKVSYVGRDPELQQELPGAVPITRVLNPDRMLWVRRPSGLDVSVPMSDVEVVP